MVGKNPWDGKITDGKKQWGFLQVVEDFGMETGVTAGRSLPSWEKAFIEEQCWAASPEDSQTGFS